MSEGADAVRGPDGRYALPDEWSWDWPMLGLSWEDADAFARWKTARARAAGLDVTYSLPKMPEWVRSWGGVDEKEYPFGHKIRPKWVSSAFARPVPNPEPGMRFPIDESVLGVFDMSGSICEYQDEWWGREKTPDARRYGGGCWGYAGRAYYEMFAIYGGNGSDPKAASHCRGIRLVMREE